MFVPFLKYKNSKSATRLSIELCSEMSYSHLFTLKCQKLHPAIFCYRHCKYAIITGVIFKYTRQKLNNASLIDIDKGPNGIISMVVRLVRGSEVIEQVVR